MIQVASLVLQSYPDYFDRSLNSRIYSKEGLIYSPRAMWYRERNTDQEARPWRNQQLRRSRLNSIARRPGVSDFSTRNRVVPWADWVAVIEPVSPKAEGPGRSSVGVERMLRRILFTLRVL